jgi:hypothetical protein
VGIEIAMISLEFCRQIIIQGICKMSQRINSKPSKSIFGLIMFAMLGSQSAFATLIDFDDVTHPTVVNNAYSALGITFSGISGADVTTWSTTPASAYPPNHSPLSDPNMAVSDDSGIRMDFVDGVTSLSLYGVDYGGSDFEVATLSAYDGIGTLLATTTVPSTRGSRIVDAVLMPTDVAFLSLATSADIAYAEFTFTNGSFFGIDDVEFTSVRVPEPAALFLMSAGLLGFAATRKKRK